MTQARPEFQHCIPIINDVLNVRNQRQNHRLTEYSTYFQVYILDTLMQFHLQNTVEHLTIAQALCLLLQDVNNAACCTFTKSPLSNHIGDDILYLVINPRLLFPLLLLFLRDETGLVVV